VNFIEKAKEENYQVTCLFFWLYSVELAISRVKTRVNEGGELVRYPGGITNPTQSN
jgi:predicted ABC-type ATPase